MLQQQDDGPCDPVFDICPVVPDLPIVVPEPTPAPTPQPVEVFEETGRFTAWMLAPIVQIIGGAITAYDQTSQDEFPLEDALCENDWMWVSEWSIYSSASYLIWYHELYRGGINHKDKMFASFNIYMMGSFLVQAGLTANAYATDECDSTPTTSTANIVTVLLGSAITGLFRAKQNRDAALMEEMESLDGKDEAAL